MKKEKLSLKSIKNVLSRAEMKQIMAGSGSDGWIAKYGWCSGMAGAWTYVKPVSWDICIQDLQTYCNGHGYCD